MNSLKQDYLIVSLTNSVGGAEQCLKLIAAQTKGQILFLRKVKSNFLEETDPLKTNYITKLPLLFGFLLLPFSLYRYRNSTIISSHAYLNATIGFLKRIGYLKRSTIARESTSIFVRYRGLKRLSYKIAYWLGYPGLDRIVCQSELMSEQLLKHNVFINPQKVKVIPNPIDLTHVINKANQSRPVLSDKYICSAGRLIQIKGFDLLIKAFSLLILTHKDLKLFILGVGPEKDNLLSLIKQLKLSKSVLLLGYKENPYPYFKHASVCVLPSIMEGFPNVLLQMIAVNHKVVTTLCAGGIESIPGITIVNVNDIMELHNGINNILVNKKNGTDLMIDAYLAKRNPGSFLRELLADLD